MLVVACLLFADWVEEPEAAPPAFEVAFVDITIKWSSIHLQQSNFKSKKLVSQDRLRVDVS